MDNGVFYRHTITRLTSEIAFKLIFQKNINAIRSTTIIATVNVTIIAAAIFRPSNKKVTKKTEPVVKINDISLSDRNQVSRISALNENLPYLRKYPN